VWFDAEVAADGGDRLRLAAYPNLERFLSERALAASLPLPARGVLADVFLRFVACARGLTPSFATGPFDALNAVATSRIRDAYELQLVAREGLDDGFDGLPSPGPDLAGIADPAVRRARMQDAILDSYPASGRAGSPGELDPLPEHPQGIDRTAVFIARIVIPVGPANPPARTAGAVLVDGGARRFVPSALLLARWVGA
jgi:hypothetical protein